MEHPKQPELLRERQVSFHSGADTRLSPWLLGNEQCAHVENMAIAEVGRAKTRRGCRAFGGVAAAPGGLDGYNDAAYDEFLLGIWGHAAYKSDGDGGWARIGTGTSLVPGLLHQIVRGRHLGGLAAAVATVESPTETSLGIGGRSPLLVYAIDSDLATQVSLAPAYVTPFQSRLFYAEAETLGWSEIGDFASYSDVNQILVEPGIGGRITALVPGRDEDPKMFIFKEKAILLFSPRWGTAGGFIPGAADALDTVNSSLRILTRGTGCVSPRSALWVPGEQGADIFFLSPEGVRSLQRAENDVPTGAGFPLSYGIPDWIDRINFSHASKAVAAFFDNAYHLAVPMDGARDNTHILRYDIAGKAWTLHSLQARDLSTLRLGANNRLFMQNMFPSGDTSTTDFVAASQPYQAYHVYGGTFDPATSATNLPPPVPRLETRSYIFDEPDTKKRWSALSLVLSAGETCSLELAYALDQGPWIPMTEARLPGTLGTVLLGVDPLVWEATADLVRRRSFGLQDLQPGYGLQFRIGGITNATDAGSLSIYQLRVDATPKNAEMGQD